MVVAFSQVRWGYGWPLNSEVNKHHCPCKFQFTLLLLCVCLHGSHVSPIPAKLGQILFTQTAMAKRPIGRPYASSSSFLFRSSLFRDLIPKVTNIVRQGFYMITVGLLYPIRNFGPTALVLIFHSLWWIESEFWHTLSDLHWSVQLGWPACTMYQLR